MRKNDIKISQICALFLTLLPLGKIISAPSYFAQLCNEKLWQPVIILFLVDILFIFYIFFIIKKAQNKTFFAILSDNYSEFFAKTVYFIYAIFFLIKAFLPLIEHKSLIENSFYESLPSPPVFYPLFAVTVYISLKGLKTLGRAAQIGTVITWTGLGITLYLSATTGDWQALLPIFYGTTKSTAICSLNGILWFNDAIYLLFFMGHFDTQKHGLLKLIISYAVPSVAIILFFCCFYSIFTSVAATQKLAINTISIFSVALENVGRFDYLAVFLLAATNVLSVAFPILLSTKCLERALGTKKALIPSLIVNSILAAATIAFSQKYDLCLNVCVKYFVPFLWFCAYILPLTAIKNGKSYLAHTVPNNGN